ncbi:TetR/AcrR family transcriptional regulator [Streptomyces sp. NPDC026672]|uniref:TetR/AcrR family transcriptional regulator n=1 Tax=unclassified Streptomyces TaxID=2593676 RepID=UPI0033CCA661
MARPRKFDESDVLERARDRFWQSGYDATTMQDLCEATGVASQSLYGAFGSKHGVFARSLGAYCAGQVRGLGENLECSTDPWASLMTVVVFEDGDGRLPLGPDGCFLSSSAAGLARRDDTVRDLSRSTYDGILHLLRTQLERARAAGQLREGVDLDTAAAGMLSAMQGIEFLAKSGVDTEIRERARTATIAMLTAAYAHPDLVGEQPGPDAAGRTEAEEREERSAAVSG